VDYYSINAKRAEELSWFSWLAHIGQFTNKVELCADELVVGGGVGWSYDRRRRRAAHSSSAAAASAASDRMREQ